ncbi:MAG: S-layer protein [Candidatus Aenigmarchaeota archaeon]|nr:S-layer protein [Candidatus Aenigmarchaeota archaeon]
MTLVKKLGAIALGSILLASTLVPLAAAQLDVKTAVERLGAPGDYWIVVGRDALVDDIISAIDLATRFAGFATTEKQLTGTKEYEIKGWDVRLNLDSDDLETGLPGFISIYDKNVLPQLKDNLVVRNGTRSISGVAEYVKLGKDNGDKAIQLASEIYANSTLAIALSPQGEGKYYLKYYVALDDNTCKNRIYADATQGLLVRFKLAGKDVVISEVGNNEVKLLSGFGPEWINAGDVRDITGTSYKLRLDNVIGFGSDAVVQLSVIDERGVAYPLVLYPGQYDVEPTTEVKVVVLRAFGFGDTKMAYLVAGVESEVKDGDRLDNIFKWYVATCSGTGVNYLKEIGYKLAPNETVYLEPGQSIAFPNNYLKLQYLGLTLTEKDYLATVNFRVVDMPTDKDKYYGVCSDLSSVSGVGVEISGVPLYTKEKVYDKLYAIHATCSSQNISAIVAYDSKDQKYVKLDLDNYPVTVGPTGLSLGSNLEGDDDDKDIKVTLSKSGSNLDIIVDDEDKVITNVVGARNSDFQIGVDNLISNFNNTWVYTAFGHKIFVSSDAKSLTLKWTPVQGYARVVLGEATEKVAGGEVVRVLDVNRLQVPVAKLDTEVNLATADKNLVVVGGPYVNRVAAALLNVPYRDDSAIRALYGDLGAIERGLIKAFDLGGGKVALLVAGWRAEDTRLAASVLQQYERFADRLAAGDTLIIGGTREAPTIEAKTSK